MGRLRAGAGLRRPRAGPYDGLIVVAAVSALLTFGGWSGLSIGSDAQVAMHRFHAPQVELPSGSAGFSYVPLCRGRTKAAAVYLGATPDAWLQEIDFYAGVRTDRGIGIGSTAAAVRRAYPEASSGYGRLYATGPPAPAFGGRERIRATIVFRLRALRVDAIAFTMREIAKSRLGTLPSVAFRCNS